MISIYFIAKKNNKFIFYWKINQSNESTGQKIEQKYHRLILNETKNLINSLAFICMRVYKAVDDNNHTPYAINEYLNFFVNDKQYQLLPHVISSRNKYFDEIKKYQMTNSYFSATLPLVIVLVYYFVFNGTLFSTIYLLWNFLFFSIFKSSFKLKESSFQPKLNFWLFMNCLKKQNSLIKLNFWKKFKRLYLSSHSLRFTLVSAIR